MWAVEFAVSRLQAAKGTASVCVLSIFANGFPLMMTAKFDQ
jgi:hypothetical protein